MHGLISALSIYFPNFVKNNAMNIQAEKLEIMRLILETNNTSILESIKELFAKSAAVDFWDTLPQEQKDDILLGIKEVEQGEVEDYDDFMKKHR